MASQYRKSLQEIIEEKSRNIDSVKVLTEFSFRKVSGITYDTFSLCQQDNTDHQRLFYAFISDLGTFKAGYGLAASIYNECLEAKKSGKNYMFSKVKVGEHYVMIAKGFNSSEILAPDTITPTRFCMVLSQAAATLYDLWKGGKNLPTGSNFPQVMLELYKDITNPIALFHGFYPSEEPEKRTDDSCKMMFYYLTMTIGFDSVIQLKPAKAVAMGLYRCWGKNPARLGLLKDLDITEADLTDGINEFENSELTDRCLQGLYRRKFRMNDDEYKLEDLLNDDGFSKRVARELKFLLDHAKPTKNKAQRSLRVANLMLKNVQSSMMALESGIVGLGATVSVQKSKALAGSSKEGQEKKGEKKKEEGGRKKAKPVQMRKEEEEEKEEERKRKEEDEGRRNLREAERKKKQQKQKGAEEEINEEYLGNLVEGGIYRKGGGRNVSYDPAVNGKKMFRKPVYVKEKVEQEVIVALAMSLVADERNTWSQNKLLMDATENIVDDIRVTDAINDIYATCGEYEEVFERLRDLKQCAMSYMSDKDGDLMSYQDDEKVTPDDSASDEVKEGEEEGKLSQSTIQKLKQLTGPISKAYSSDDDNKE